MQHLHTFRFWCQKVLPLVYDDSLGYYEVLCKVTDYINNLIANQRELINDVETLEAELKIVQDWINNFDPQIAQDIIEKYIAHGVYFGLSDSGYFITYIPQGWRAIKFNTTGLDIQLPCHPEYGRLVLSY